jgi:hypothetical protein
MSSSKRAMAHNTVGKSQPIAGFIILFASVSILSASPSFRCDLVFGFVRLGFLRFAI